jgi:hypothetical protein
MTTAEDEALLEKASAEKIIADTPLFEGVDSISVEIGNDYDGDPAMWLNFHLTANLEPSKDWFTRFVEYDNKLGLRIVHSGLKRFPYSRLRTAA